jgi:hypothetical protein
MPLRRGLSQIYVFINGILNVADSAPEGFTLRPFPHLQNALAWEYGGLLSTKKRFTTTPRRCILAAIEVEKKNNGKERIDRSPNKINYRFK